MAISAQMDDFAFTFGVSGLLYNSDVLFYNRQTESLWSRLMAQGISGPIKGRRLHPLPLTNTTWRDWKNRHPDTQALSADTGYVRDYTKNPYEDYLHNRSLLFPVNRTSQRDHPKEPVLGIEIEGRFKAFPSAELGRAGGTVRGRFAGRDLRITFSAQTRGASASGAEGRELPTVIAFWFAWYAFHPETEVFPSDP